MRIINVENQNSQIYIGENYRNVRQYLPDKPCFLICDSNIHNYYQDFVEQFPHIIIETGEKIKNWSTVESIIEQLLELGADRNSFILGMGGGVVCDIAGFVASVYMRGMEFGFISTSLLSQVDASLGGKNGINIGGLKNMVGVFNPPKFVICDPRLLNTLPAREVRSGFGEIIKHALIQDEELFTYLEDNREDLLNLEADLMEDLIYRAVRIKADIVQTDPLEKGERKKLNFGHTFGHAIENNSPLTHGEAVSIGMMLACLLSNEMGKLASQEIIRIQDLLNAYQLPVATGVKNETIIEYLSKDKKKENNRINFIMLEKIGKAIIQAIPVESLNTCVPTLKQKANLLPQKH
jgi:3-dehydroquinate synthase